MTTKEQEVRRQKILLAIYPLAWVAPTAVAELTEIKTEDVIVVFEQMCFDGLAVSRSNVTGRTYKLTSLGRLSRRIMRRVLERGNDKR